MLNEVVNESAAPKLTFRPRHLVIPLGVPNAVDLRCGNEFENTDAGSPGGQREENGAANLCMFWLTHKKQVDENDRLLAISRKYQRIN